MLGATCAVHFKLIRKLVVDFLLVIIEHFSLGVFVFLTIHAFDRQTHRRTDRQMLIRRPRLHNCSTVKTLLHCRVKIKNVAIVLPVLDDKAVNQMKSTLCPGHISSSFWRAASEQVDFPEPSMDTPLYRKKSVFTSRPCSVLTTMILV